MVSCDVFRALVNSFVILFFLFFYSVDILGKFVFSERQVEGQWLYRTMTNVLELVWAYSCCWCHFGPIRTAGASEMSLYVLLVLVLLVLVK